MKEYVVSTIEDFGQVKFKLLELKKFWNRCNVVVIVFDGEVRVCTPEGTSLRSFIRGLCFAANLHIFEDGNRWSIRRNDAVTEVIRDRGVDGLQYAKDVVDFLEDD